MFKPNQPSPEEHTQLMQTLGQLPIEGPAWPTWIKILAWLLLIVIGIQFALTAAGPHGRDVSPYVAGSVTLCFAALIVMARTMTVSRTRITEQGIEQNWLGRRQVKWEDINFVKFIPLIASKKLVCFMHQGRPVIFQGGTKELQAAFAHISLVYRRR
jgi:hypothetical protein